MAMYLYNPCRNAPFKQNSKSMIDKPWFQEISYTSLWSPFSTKLNLPSTSIDGQNPISNGLSLFSQLQGLFGGVIGSYRSYLKILLFNNQPLFEAWDKKWSGGRAPQTRQPNPREKVLVKPSAESRACRQSTARSKRISTDCTGRWTSSQFGLGPEVCST